MLGFLLTPTYRVVRGVPEVHLYGVLESGEPCLIIDDRTRPYFYIAQRDAKQAETIRPGIKIAPIDLRSLDGEPVAQIVATLPSDVPPMRQAFEQQGIACLEADVRFAYRYLIDRGIRGAFDVDGAAEMQPLTGRVYRNPRLQPAHWKPKLRVLSIDIETSMNGEQLFSIALHSADFERVIIVHEHVLANAEPAHSEKVAIRRFLEYLHALDPDVITGWNVIDFDLAFLSRAARRHGIRFAIGRNDEEFDLRKDASFTRESRAVVFGRQVLDGLSLMRGAFIRLDDYRLETAAQAFLGKGKLLSGDGRHHEIEKLYHNEPQRLVDYNLQDARLVSELLDHTGLIDLAVERSLLTGMQLDRVSAAIASIDSLYLNALRQRGVVAPSVRGDDTSASIGGGYVMESKPGLYRNVLVFDFKSLYPSIIRTFNIDPLTHERAARVGDDLLRAPNGACFRRSDVGILPWLLTQLAQEREQAKSSGQGVKANAIKILMNSFYGVLGASASRLFSPEVANAITSFGQTLIRYAADHAQARGFDVLYGDTDSLFVLSGETDAPRALELAERLRREIGDAVAQFVRDDFGCESVLELEFEKLYHRFFLPEVRGGKVGSKKRYAGLLVEDGREEIEFVGLESVRRDWSAVSKRFQQGLLDLVFHDRPVEEFVRAFVVDLRAGRFDDELVYKKAIRKDIGAYTKTTPPHVKAARKQTTPGGRIIAYVMTMSGPEPLDNLASPPDYAHYITHQLEPIADAILRFLGTDFQSIVEPKRQLALF
ncbi:MAG: DNA polymerase II [Deltaproteobacteria bacterium]|nr:DNA polymerase II [Deltaproteobacteria bacterium]